MSLTRRNSLETTSALGASFIIAAIVALVMPDIAARQDSPDNLKHPPGYVTAPPESLGRVHDVGASGLPTVVLIPGLGFGGGVFDDFAKRNAGRLHTIAVTLPGYEGSAALPMPPDGTSYGDQTWTLSAETAIAKLIRDRRIEKPIVLGHFIVGGQLALRLAVHHPELIGGAIVVAGELARATPGPTGPGGGSLEARVASVDRYWAPQWFKTVSKETWDANTHIARLERVSLDADRAARLRSQATSVPLPVLIRYFCEFLASDVSRDLSRLEIPVLVVIPGFTPAVLAEAPALRSQQHDSWSESQKLSPFVQSITIPDARLFVMDDRPESFDDAVTTFVKRVRPD